MDRIFAAKMMSHVKGVLVCTTLLPLIALAVTCYDKQLSVVGYLHQFTP
jgi:hypothetical protein